MKSRKLRCSFCMKDETDVAKLVAGPNVYICDVCIAIATQIIKDSSSTPNPPAVNISLPRKLLNAARRLWSGHAQLGETQESLM